MSFAARVHSNHDQAHHFHEKHHLAHHQVKATQEKHAQHQHHANIHDKHANLHEKTRQPPRATRSSSGVEGIPQGRNIPNIEIQPTRHLPWKILYIQFKIPEKERCDERKETPCRCSDLGSNNGSANDRHIITENRQVMEHYLNVMDTIGKGTS
ncbi:hypothetical protein NQ318_005855 [Aromia moschata]|uniref:Uncharacterized protein n=1 Tax=Aromia moschata TaxID=1265417 RepID=A0AAV8YRI6_9CUCU|nr:hypothetical protein NQ318_005855 [Aromia moschata]